MDLTPDEVAMLDGEKGRATAMAMRVIVALADAAGAPRLQPITGAHIDGCLYHGSVGLDFAERLAAEGGRVTVPTTLNVSSLDLLHPERIRLDPETRDRARRVMDAYVAMACQPTWTCAPYQLPDRPGLGAHVAWAESNAIVFANSVLGARTGRYGDFTDICAALTGRVPFSGLHVDHNRHARIVFRIDWLGDDPAAVDELYGLVGYVVGQEAGSMVPAIAGLPRGTTEDQLKAICAAAASAGSVAMFHAVGLTPEAATLDAALGGREPSRVVDLTRDRVRAAWAQLGTGDGRRVDAVSVGTPHFSAAQLRELARLTDGRRVRRALEFYANTNRAALAEVAADGVADQLDAAGINLVADTCTYVTQIMRAGSGATVMTDSVKWAWYAPANLDVDVVYASLADCVESAVRGTVVRTPHPLLADG